jgi:hypothetical protein
VLADSVPDDPQTLEDYGFNRCVENHEKSHLLGLYIGLITSPALKFSSTTLNEWRPSDLLLDSIIEVFTRLPEEYRGGYFPWLLRNKHILDNTSNEQSSPLADILKNAMDHARKLLSPRDRNMLYNRFQPIKKLDAVIMFAMRRAGIHPNPMGPRDLFYSFGFCTCKDEYEERTRWLVQQVVGWQQTATRHRQEPRCTDSTYSQYSNSRFPIILGCVPGRATT